MVIFRRRLPLTGLSNVCGVGKNRDSRRIAGYRSMAASVRTTATVDGAVYCLPHTTPRIHCCGGSRHWWTWRSPYPLGATNFFLTTQITSHKTEQNLIVGRSKSEAELVLDILWIVLLADTKYRAASLWQQDYLFNPLSGLHAPSDGPSIPSRCFNPSDPQGSIRNPVQFSRDITKTEFVRYNKYGKFCRLR